MGRTIDMGALAAKNEKIRAVSNLSVNARGDTIDSKGNIVTTANKRIGNQYKQTVTNRSANPTKSMYNKPIQADPLPTDEELTAAEMEIDDEPDAAEIEAIKAAELNAAPNNTDSAAPYTIKPASEAPEFFEPTTTKKTK